VNPPVSWPITYRFSGNNPALAREFSALFTSCGFEETSRGDAQITIVFVPQDQSGRSHLWSEPLVDWRGLRITGQGKQFLFSYRLCNLELEPERGIFRCSGPAPDPENRLIFREFFLLSPILFLMHRLGYFELHAAACAHEDFGYLLLGASGSGKTTTILSLIASGWNYLSDDAMVVSADPERGILIRPLRRSFSLKPDHFVRHPELAMFPTEFVPATNKRRLDPRQVWPEQYAAAAKPSFIIACKVADGEMTRIIPISPAETLARLVASTPWLMFDQAMAPMQLDIFRSLAATCCGFELRAGHDLVRNGDRITSFIAPEALHELAGRKETWA
jgi:hypothetical protein